MYTEILQSKLLHLPITQNGNSFKESVQDLLLLYLDEIKKLDDGPLAITDLPHIEGEYVKSVQTKFIQGLLDTIDVYHDGQPAKAFERLSETLINDLKNFREVLKIREYQVDESFFRMRIIKGNFPLPPIEMFHIPFEKRGYIKTQRYSIPGFPCLYLGRTIYGCWEEMSRPDTNEFQVARLKNLQPINFLDLTHPHDWENLYAKDLYHYFMTWPLIACCSVKVKDYSLAFKSEYIIPQLLLQWIREQQQLDGIKFDSTHIDFHKSNSKGDFSNLVLPVKENKPAGHCSKLAAMFEITEPISWQMHESAIGGQNFSGTFEDSEIGVNKRIQELELIKGRAYPYSYSILGKLESYLDGMPTSRIN